ncbi:ADM_HP2_G0007610.mRNA.1.CDS.1 [Saccharomyces cerevisiae]|nr:ADM_HP2_G0007610.mRNA.1.CDS.1 [Saccharomyces cerevisiae]CAI6422186.1 ADM_HP2_G0007610.mRNA.1.CDS.1 [Saccharomyces cerevisiae]
MHKFIPRASPLEIQSTNENSEANPETASGRVSTATDWGTVSSSKNKNKKYGCLSDIAKVLRNQ